MGKIKSLLALFILTLVLVGCTNSNELNNTEQLPISSTIADVNASEIETIDDELNSNTDDFSAEEQFDETLLLNPVYNFLNDLMTYTISTESLRYTTRTEDEYYYISEANGLGNYVYYSENYEGVVDRDNGYAILHRNYSHMEEIAGTTSLDLLNYDEHKIEFYINNDQGIYFISDIDDTWLHEPASENLQTMNSLADIINIFLEHYEYVTMEKVIDPNDSEFGKTQLKLELTPEQYVNNIETLTQNYFNGYHNGSNFDYVHSLKNNVELLKVFYVNLFVDEGEVTMYHTYYSLPTSTESEDDYNSFFMRTDFYDYNAAIVDLVPQEAIELAIHYSYMD